MVANSSMWGPAIAIPDGALVVRWGLGAADRGPEVRR